MGHLYRQLSLAQAVAEREVPLVLASRALPDLLRESFVASGVEVVMLDGSGRSGDANDACSLRSLALERNALAVVCDGYAFDASFLHTLVGPWCVAAFDDIAHQPLPADIVVNVNFGAEHLTYDAAPHTAFLLGVDYAMLRAQFRLARAQASDHQPIDEVTRVLVSMGGGENAHALEVAVGALLESGFCGQADVLLGATPASSLGAVCEQARQMGSEVRLLTGVGEMASLMSEQHLAVCAAGGTTWELACLGVPIAHVLLHDNQRVAYEALSAQRLTAPLGSLNASTKRSHLIEPMRVLLADTATRLRMTHAGRELIDARGPHRVLDALLSTHAFKERS